MDAYYSIVGAPYSTFTQADYDHLIVHFTAGTGDEVFEFSSHTTNATPGTGFDRYFDHPEEDEWWNISAGLSEDAADGVPVVSIAATDAEAWETPLTDQQDNKLSFTVTRSGNEEDGDFDEALTVLLHPPAGTATPSDDYTGLPSSVTIAAGQSSATFDVTAVQDNKTETDETIALCLKAAQDYRLAAFTAIATIHNVSVDLAIDSNNDNKIDDKDDLIEADPNKPGKYLDIDNTDADYDFIPDYADGFHIAGKSNSHDDSDFAQFTLIQLTIPDGIDLNTAAIRFSYDASDPNSVIVPPSEATGLAMPWDYKPASGLIRLWTKNADVARNAASASDNGNYIPKDVLVKLSDLGFTATKRTIPLYVEAVSRDPNNYFAVQSINVDLAPDGANVKTSDTVNVTCVYNPNGWRAIARQEAGFDLKNWNPNMGFNANEANVRRIYNFYGDLYLKDFQAHGNGATLGAFQWAGMAKVAGASIVFSLKTMNDSTTYLAALTQASTSLAAGGSLPYQSLLDSLPAMVTGNVQAHLEDTQAEFMRMTKAIFDDMYWQHVAYRDAGINEILRLGDKTPDLPGPKAKAAGAAVDLVEAWTLIDSGLPASVWSGNFHLIDQEQNVVLEQYYSHFRGTANQPLYMIDPFLNRPGLTVPQALTIGTLFREPFSGASTFAGWTVSLPSLKYLTSKDDRWLYIGGVLWQQWMAKNQQQRFTEVNQPLP